jgi:hypothetical protein
MWEKEGLHLAEHGALGAYVRQHKFKECCSVEQDTDSDSSSSSGSITLLNLPITDVLTYLDTTFLFNIHARFQG